MEVENTPDDVSILEPADLIGRDEGYGTAITEISREQIEALLAGKLLSFSVQWEYGCVLRLSAEGAPR
jgi:hypothetical protein